MIFRCLTRVGVVVTVAACITALSQDIPASAVVEPGWDWSLPQEVEPASYSGFVTWGAKRHHPSITVSGIHIRWKQLNPAPGEYRWDLLHKRIEANRQAGMRTGLHLTGVERQGIPEWVMETHKPPVFDVPVLSEDQPWRLQNVAAWHPGVDTAYHKFLEAFGRTGIPRNDDVVYAYIHAISPSRGEELWMRPIDLQMYEKAGLTPELFGRWLRRRIDAMCMAFKGVEYKLAWMGGGPVGPTPGYRAATTGLAEYAFSKGAGVRGGGIDFQHGLFAAPAWASRITAAGYAEVDDAHPTIAQKRYRGDENEEYGTYWEWRFGPADKYGYRHRISTLRALQMRQNFQMVSRATLELNPKLNAYVLLTQGRRREDSPDAWAYLRECSLRGRPVKNIERWLTQRDYPGSLSEPAERIDRFKLYTDRPEHHYDFDARRTDVANGQSGLLFRLDRAFWSRSAAAIVKVTFTDRAQTSWWLRYTDGQGRVVQSATVENVGDGQRKTATFALPSLAASGVFPQDVAFRNWLAADPGEPENVVMNAAWSGGETDWSRPELYEIAPDPDREGERLVRFSYQRLDDTVHMDQLVTLEKDAAYRLSAQIRNDGKGLRPGVRIGRMDWSTLLYLEAARQGDWENVSGIFTADADSTFRLQLFGQGRGNYAPGISGTSAFRNIVLKRVPRTEQVGEPKMDFRLETAGPGDVTVTMARVIKISEVDHGRQPSGEANEQE